MKKYFSIVRILVLVFAIGAGAWLVPAGTASAATNTIEDAGVTVRVAREDNSFVDGPVTLSIQFNGSRRYCNETWVSTHCDNVGQYFTRLVTTDERGYYKISPASYGMLTIDSAKALGEQMVNDYYTGSTDAGAKSSALNQAQGLAAGLPTFQYTDGNTYLTSDGYALFARGIKTILPNLKLDEAFIAGESVSAPWIGGYNADEDRGFTLNNNGILGNVQVYVASPRLDAFATAALKINAGVDYASAALLTVKGLEPEAPVVNFTASPSSILKGESSTLSWTLQNVASCKQKKGDGAVWGNDSDVSDAEGTLNTGSLDNTITYGLECTGNDNSVVNKEATITVNNPPVVPDPVITSFTADKTTINSGESVTLNWVVENTDSCKQKKGDGTVWGSDKVVTGNSKALGALTQTNTYGLECTGNSKTVSKELTVTVNPVNPGDPIVTLVASKTLIKSGESVTLTWTLQNTSSCKEKLGDGTVWGSDKAITANGTRNTGAIIKATTYGLDCTGNNKTVSKQVTVQLEGTTPVIQDGSIFDQEPAAAGSVWEFQNEIDSNNILVRFDVIRAGTVLVKAADVPVKIIRDTAPGVYSWVSYAMRYTIGTGRIYEIMLNKG